MNEEMSVKKEAIEQEIARLQKAKEQAIGQVNAINGALQALTALIVAKPKEEVAKNE